MDRWLNCMSSNYRILKRQHKYKSSWSWIWKWILRYDTQSVSKQKTVNTFSSIQFSHSVVSDSLQPHELQHTRLLPCSSSTPRACSSSCPLSQSCRPTISSSVVPVSSCLQSFPASGSFLMSQVFASGGQRIGVSASTSVLPMNIQDWFPLG